MAAEQRTAGPGQDAGISSRLRRWLRPDPAAEVAGTAAAVDLRGDYERVFAQIGRSEFERVLVQRHADAAAAFAAGTLAEADQLRAEVEAQAMARAAAEAQLAQQRAAAGTAAAGLARWRATAEAEAAARAAAEASAEASQGQASAEAAARTAADAALAAARQERDAALARAAAAEAALEHLREAHAALTTARNTTEFARNLAQAEVQELRVELLRLRAEFGVPLAEPAPAGPPVPFDEDWYLATYGDAKAAVKAKFFESGLDHYLKHGRAEGRQPLPGPAA